MKKTNFTTKFSNTIKYLLGNFDYKYTNQDEKFR